MVLLGEGEVDGVCVILAVTVRVQDTLEVVDGLSVAVPVADTLPVLDIVGDAVTEAVTPCDPDRVGDTDCVELDVATCDAVAVNVCV